MRIGRRWFIFFKLFIFLHESVKPGWWRVVRGVINWRSAATTQFPSLIQQWLRERGRERERGGEGEGEGEGEKGRGRERER